MTRAKKKPTTRAPSSALSIEYVPLDQLRPYENNARMHDEAQVAMLARSIEAYGWAAPILIESNGTVVAGHGRLEAAKLLGLDSAPVVRLEHLSAEQARALRIADNRLAEHATWDWDKLSRELDELKRQGLDITPVGFDAQEIDRLLADARELDTSLADETEDDVGELPSVPRTRRGDVWILGPHRLLCGDCREPDDVARLIGPAKVTVAITSPPYASQREYDATSEFRPIPPDEYCDWFQGVQALVASVLADDGSFFVNLKEHCEDGQRHLYVKDLVIRHVRSWGWRFVEEFAWIHGGTPKAAVQRFKNAWEPVFRFRLGENATEEFETIVQFAKARHAFRPRAVRRPTRDVPSWNGAHPSMEHLQGAGGEYSSTVGRDVASGDEQGTTRGATGNYVNKWLLAYPSNVISCGKNREATGHPAAFPVSLPAFFLRAYSDPGDMVFDPFTGSGSGSVLVAAHEIERVARLMEISPRYCDLIVDRWQRLTGSEAVLERSTST